MRKLIEGTWIVKLVKDSDNKYYIITGWRRFEITNAQQQILALLDVNEINNPLIEYWVDGEWVKNGKKI